MKNLFSVNLKPFAVYLGSAAGLMTILTHAVVRGAPAALVLIAGLVILFSVTGAVFSREQYEEKHGGYAFLRILPLRPSSIAAAKFLPMAAGTALLTAYMIFLFTGATEATEARLLIRGYLLFAGCLAAGLSALFYLGLFLMGYTRFLVVVLSATTALGLVPMILLNSYKGRMDILVDGLLLKLKSITLLPSVASSLGICLLFFIASAFALSRRKSP